MFEDLIVQKLPTPPLAPEQSFVTRRGFVPRSVWFREDAAETENVRAASKTTATASARTLFGNPARPVIEASFVRRASLTEPCAARSLFAEPDLFTTGGFHICLASLGCSFLDDRGRENRRPACQHPDPR